MATISTGHSAQAPTGSESLWHLIKATIASSIALVFFAPLAGCGGGGSSATPETLAVAPVSVLPPVATVTVAANLDGTVEVKSDVAIAGASSVSWLDATGNPVNHALTLAADQKSGVPSLGGVPSKLPEGVTEVTAAINFEGTTTPAKVSKSLSWCPAGTLIAGGKCKMAPFRMGVVFDFDRNTQIKFYDLATGVADPANTIVWNGTDGKPFLHNCWATLTPGSHGGLVMSCTVTLSATPVTVEVGRGGWWKVVDNINHSSETDYVSARYSLARPVCTNGVTRVAPGSTGDEMCWAAINISFGTVLKTLLGGPDFAVVFDSNKM